MKKQGVLRNKLRPTLAVLCALSILAGCETSGVAASRGAVEGHNFGPPPATESQIDALARAIKALGPRVDPEEADRAARIAFEQSRKQAIEYDVRDTPLTHNMKVNMGIKDRGLCWQWADDLETRLEKEHFKTLTLHRAIANAFNPIWIDHSTLLISQKGDTLYQGIVLDPWRKGGELTWMPTMEDPKYEWVPEAEVFARKRELGWI